MKGQSCKNKLVRAFLFFSLHLPCQDVHNNPHLCPAGSSSFSASYFLVVRNFYFSKFLHMGHRHFCECWRLNFGVKSREFSMQWCNPDLNRPWATQQQEWEFAGKARHIRQTNQEDLARHLFSGLADCCIARSDWLTRKSYRRKSMCGDSYLWLLPVSKGFRKLHLCIFCLHNSDLWPLKMFTHHQLCTLSSFTF